MTTVFIVIPSLKPIVDYLKIVVSLFKERWKIKFMLNPSDRYICRCGVFIL